ncbi:MAG: hypothetical protein R2849_06680 [Thermomicrobiales bacterium]
MLRRVPVRLVLFALLTFMIPIVLTACAGGADNPQSTIDPAGAAADEIVDIYSLIWWLAVVVFVLVEGALIFAIFKFRNNKKLINGRLRRRFTETHGWRSSGR